VINATAASLLGFLEICPATGWELMAQIELSIGKFWNVTRSQVYRELGSLAADGLVKAGDLGPRDSRPYEITDKGRAAFTEWINKEPGPELIRAPLLLTVFFREHVEPERLQRYLTSHRLRHQTQLEEYERLEVELQNEPGGPLDALRFGIAYERWFLERLEEIENRSRATATSATLAPGSSPAAKASSRA
jgi:DNA-binding PadR family transcriptional regulator